MPGSERSGGRGAGTPAKAPAGSRRLEGILRLLPPRELDGLVSRLKIKVDPQKRIDVPSQVARLLVGLPDVRDPERLPAPSRELLHRVAEAGGLLVVAQLPQGFEPLMARGVLFGRRAGDSIEIVLPWGYLVQLPSWPNEDPRSLRALIAQAPFETVSAIASHYLGRPATPPIALALEPAWEAVSDPARLRSEIEALPILERRLLEAIDAEGGEVETGELLDLEREPMRLRSAKGVATTRRGAGFALERRGLLIPIHPNRHVVPSEVAAIVGADRGRDREKRRAQIRSELIAEDHAPRRAQFGKDPSGLALALAVGVREGASEVKPHVGIPRSLVSRLAQRFGRSPETISLVASLSRAVGLWEPAALGTASPPGALAVGELGGLLFRAWLRGGAWDEARGEPEILRAPPDQREPSPLRPLRELVLEALAELGVDGWLPFGALARYVREDPRVPGLERLLRRWAERAGVVGQAPAVDEIVRRIALETLPVLGLVDLGDDSRAMSAVLPGEPIPADEVARATLRLTSRGRAVARELEPLRAGEGDEGPIQDDSGVRTRTPSMPTPSRFIDSQILRVGSASLVGHVLTLGALTEVGRIDDTLDLVLSPQTIARAISAGAFGDEIRERIEAVAPLPDSLSQILAQASAVVGRGTLAAAAGFLWVDDPEVREMLRTRRATADLFVDPSPPGGLIVAPTVDAERLVRRCRGLGIEVETSDDALRTVATRPATARPPAAEGSRPGRGGRRTPFPKTR